MFSGNTTGDIGDINFDRLNPDITTAIHFVHITEIFPNLVLKITFSLGFLSGVFRA